MNRVLRPIPYAHLCAGLVLVPALLAIVLELVHPSARIYQSDDQAVFQIQVREAARGALLLGPYSRFEWRHPGPLFAYLLAPAYRLTGGAPASLYVGTAVLSFASLCVACLAWFRATKEPEQRLVFLVSLGVHLASFTVPWSARALSDTWNPMVGLVHFTALSVLCVAIDSGASVFLPYACFLHALVSQTHVEYALPATAALSFVAARLVSRRNQDVPWKTAGAVTLASWSLTVFEALSNHGGNVRALLSYFGGPEARPAPARWSIAATLLTWPFGYVPGAEGGRVRSPLSAAVVLVLLGIVVALGVKELRRPRLGRLSRSVLQLTLLEIAVSLLAVLRMPADPRHYVLLWLKVVFFLGVLCFVLVANERIPAISRALVGPMSGSACVLLASGTAIAQLPKLMHPTRDGKVASVRAATRMLSCILKRSRVPAPVLRFDQRGWRVPSGVILDQLEHGQTLLLPKEQQFRFGDVVGYVSDPRAAARIPTVFIPSEPPWRLRADVDLNFEGNGPIANLDEGWTSIDEDGTRRIAMGKSALLGVGLFPGFDYLVWIVARSGPSPNARTMRVVANDHVLGEVVLGPSPAEGALEMPAEMVRAETLMAFVFDDVSAGSRGGGGEDAGARAVFERLRFEPKLGECSR